MKSFKEYRKEKIAKAKVYLQPYDSMETSFGQHSLEKKYVQPYDSMETSFGQHSLEKPKLQEDFEQAEYTSLSVPERTKEEHDNVHDNIAPIHSELLKPHEIQAIKQYSDDSKMLNSMHHSNDKNQDISAAKYDKHKNQTGSLDSALEKHKTIEDTHLYTGIIFSPAKHFRPHWGKIPNKAIVHLPAYTSTSTSLATAEGFSKTDFHPRDSNHGIDEIEGGRHVLKLHVPAGTHAMSIRSHSFLPEEKEVLVHRGHNIEIDKTPEKIGEKSYLWNARIIGHNPKPV